MSKPIERCAHKLDWFILMREGTGVLYLEETIEPSWDRLMILEVGGVTDDRLFATVTQMLWQLNRELKQPWRRRRQKRYKFAYLTIKNAVLHALHVHFSISYISLQFSFFTRREMACFVCRWRWHMMTYFQFFFLIAKPLISIELRDKYNTFCRHNDMELLKNYCRNAQLYFQMTFSLS